MATTMSHGVNCRIESSENRVRNLFNRTCNLVFVSFKEMVDIFPEEEFVIPCFACSNYANYSDYLRHCEYHFANSIYRCSYPYLVHSQDIAMSMASDLVNRFVHPANATHRCSTLYFTSHNLRISIQRLAVPPFETALTESFYEAGPAAKPASLSFLSELFRARGEKEKEDGDRYELDWSPADHDCSICIDEIEKPWDSLTLPCSHIFHETCILRWLEKNHVCPLCRFQMPTEN